MATACIPDAIRPRLGQFVRLLASDQPGEVVAAAAALRRALAGVGADLNDLGDDIAAPPAPLMILQNRPTSSAPRRSRKAHSSSPGGVELGPARRHHVVDVLIRASMRGALSAWEEDFAASIITVLRSARPRLSARQYEIVERLPSRFGEA